MFGFTFDLAVDVNIPVDQVDLLARQPDESLDVVLPLVEGEDYDVPAPRLAQVVGEFVDEYFYFRRPLLSPR